jgi:hypothetical protein
MNNVGLVDYAKKCLELGNNSVYVYGSWGNKLTTSFCDNKYKQYPSVNTKSRTTKYKKLCDGKHYGFDCVGLIKSYYWGGYGKAKYNAKTDVSANGMYDKAKVKGKIATMDKSRKGLLVQMDGHIGVYIGNNEVIECTISTKYAKQSHGLGGVCKTKLSDRKWTHWLECPYIDYVEEKKAQGTITVKDGSWNIREGAGTQYPVVRVVKGGAKLNHYGTENGWYKLDDGYISSKAVKTTTTKATVKPASTSTTKTSYYKKCSSKYNSIVDALKSIGVDSSFSNRKKIAKKNGISIYLGTPNQNSKLLNLLKNGKLVK